MRSTGEMFGDPRSSGQALCFLLVFLSKERWILRAAFRAGFERWEACFAHVIVMIEFQALLLLVSLRCLQLNILSF
jgi:hypothetical protein